MKDILEKTSCDLSCLDDVLTTYIQNDVIQDNGLLQVLHLTLRNIIYRLDEAAGL